MKTSFEILFEDLNQTYFSGDLPLIEMTWNSRLRSSAGRFFPGSRKWIRDYPPRIEIASYLLGEAEAEKLIRDTLAHEMIHYWLWHRRRPYGHTAEFHAKLKEVGGPRYNPVPKQRPHKYIYRCPGCTKEFKARRRLKSLACLACCKQHAGGKFDARFKLYLETEIETSRKPLSTTPCLGTSESGKKAT